MFCAQFELLLRGHEKASPRTATAFGYPPLPSPRVYIGIPLTAYSASTNWISDLFWRQTVHGLAVTTHPHPVPSLGPSRSIPLLPRSAAWHVIGEIYRLFSV